MAGEISQLDDEPREARTRPARLVHPHGELPEHRLDDRFRRSCKLVTERPKSLQREFMLCLEHAREQIVLAPEMMIDRPLRQPRGSRDLIHADTAVPLPAEEAIGALENTLARLLGRSRHLAYSGKVYCIVNLHRRAAD